MDGEGGRRKRGRQRNKGGIGWRGKVARGGEGKGG